jgi:RNA polymerase sigma-70 factor (ECF subfamily)
LQEPGNTDDWNLFVSIYQPFIKRHLLRRQIRTEDVEDVTQEILTRVFKAIGSFAHNGRTGAFRKWLGQIVSQQAWSYFQTIRQKSKAENALLLDDAAVFHSDFQAQWDFEHDQHCLLRLLELIRPEFAHSTWQAFHLMVLQGLPSQEVSRRLNVSVNAVVISKSRVLRRLRSIAKDMIDSFD